MPRLQPLEHPPQAFVLLLQPPQPLFAYASRIPPLVLLHTFNSSTFTKIKTTHKRDDEIVVICSSKKEEGIHYHWHSQYGDGETWSRGREKEGVGEDGRRSNTLLLPQLSKVCFVKLSETPKQKPQNSWVRQGREMEKRNQWDKRMKMEEIRKIGGRGWQRKNKKNWEIEEKKLRQRRERDKRINTKGLNLTIGLKYING